MKKILIGEPVKSLIFSKYEYKTRYIDICIDCATFDDEKWEWPLNKLYNIASANKYDNILFVLGKDSYSRPVSYCGVYEVLTDKHMLGLECSCIEPLNYSTSANFKDNSVSETNLKNMKENIISRIVELFDSEVEYNLKTNSFSKLLSVNSTKEDYYACSEKKLFANPTKRNILIMFDKCSGINDSNIAAKICAELVERFVKKANKLVKDYMCNAYYWCLVSKEAANKLKVTARDYVVMPQGTFDETEIIRMLDKKLNTRSVQYDDELLKVFDYSKVKTPNGNLMQDNFSVDELCKYLFVEHLPSYLDYMHAEDLSYRDGLVCSEELLKIKESNEACLSKKEEFDRYLSRLNNKEYLDNQHKYNFYKYDEEQFSKLVNDCSSAVKISYLDGDNRLLLFPNKIVNGIDEVDESVNNLEGLDIVDGELVLVGDN